MFQSSVPRLLSPPHEEVGGSLRLPGQGLRLQGGWHRAGAAPAEGGEAFPPEAEGRLIRWGKPPQAYAAACAILLCGGGDIGAGCSAGGDVRCVRTCSEWSRSTENEHDE